jgi:hypothetical protein
MPAVMSIKNVVYLLPVMAAVRGGEANQREMRDCPANRVRSKIEVDFVVALAGAHGLPGCPGNAVGDEVNAGVTHRHIHSPRMSAASREEPVGFSTKKFGFWPVARPRPVPPRRTPCSTDYLPGSSLASLRLRAIFPPFLLWTFAIRVGNNI